MTVVLQQCLPRVRGLVQYHGGAKEVCEDVMRDMDLGEVEEAPLDVEVDRASRDKEDKTMVGTYQDKTVACPDLWIVKYFGAGQLMHISVSV